jgi:hypothetical protein
MRRLMVALRTWVRGRLRRQDTQPRRWGPIHYGSGQEVQGASWRALDDDDDERREAPSHGERRTWLRKRPVGWMRRF